jgi:1-deoxy-D-xylulose-5-phosphate reductoisomerase
VVDVIEAQPDLFDVALITAHSNAKGLAEAAQKLDADLAVMDHFEDAITQVGAVDITVAAISGMAGLKPLMAAIETSKAVAIANKEPLVAAGAQVMAAARRAGCKILPLDSEHNAVYQVLDPARVLDRIVLTASGGPFREWSLEQMAAATPQQALKHPNWEMGRKITIDSATMMNKALEVIEASILFGVKPDQIEVLVHPQSAVHGMVEYADGSVLAQMGASDMRTPVANVLGVDVVTPGRRLDLSALARLDFYAPDFERFPAIGLAYEALSLGQYACIALNAANEVAVAAFLDGQIGFLDIVQSVAMAMRRAPKVFISSLEEVIAYDKTRRDDMIAYIGSELIHKREQA